MEDMDEIVHEFLIESYENLDQLDHDLVALEQDPGSRELLSSIFRAVHTIKGTSGFLGFGTLERVSHVGESLLSELRDGKRQMDQPAADVLLALVDALRAVEIPAEPMAQTHARNAADSSIRAELLDLRAAVLDADPGFFADEDLAALTDEMARA